MLQIYNLIRYPFKYIFSYYKINKIMKSEILYSDTDNSGISKNSIKDKELLVFQ